MKLHKQGSAVLLVLIVMGILMLLMQAALMRETYMQMLVRTHLNAQKVRSVSDGLLQYGIRVAKMHFDTLKKEAQPLALEIPIDNNRGIINLIPTNGGITIRNELWDGARLKTQSSCLLSQNAQKKFTIQGFQRDTFAL